ncbi:class I SAM-dependent methyltransferase [Geothrix alkalitolerans]|uniref:class I SAM-dependent methyltransferase n=1 Tax=Geothrix alkalitolerans TaxID=2922724 RepID=UPI001FAF8A0E|nr:class I SAM-dependent methyltransferase [Geothrix alkalitolerans]
MSHVASTARPEKVQGEAPTWLKELDAASRPVPKKGSGLGRWICRLVARAALRGGRDLDVDQPRFNAALVEGLRQLSATVDELVSLHQAALRQPDHPMGLQEAVRTLREDLRAVQQRMPSAISQVRESQPEGQRFAPYYRAFEDAFRGSEAVIESRLEVYLPHVRKAFSGLRDPLWLDLGCGRGEWLRVLAGVGVRGVGVDGNAGMAEAARASGLEVQVGDLMDHLRGCEAGSVDGLSAFHVVEHLPLDLLVELLQEGLRVVKPGGLLILETPNPENLQVGAHTFYLDPTHRSPVPPAFLAFLAAQVGWRQGDILRLQADERDLARAKRAWLGNKALMKAAESLFGPRDYALVAVRPLS